MGLGDEGPQQAVAGGRVAENGSVLGRDPHRDELFDHPAVGCEHAERPVASVGEIDRQLDDAEEYGFERELRGEDHPGLDQLPVPVTSASRPDTARA